MEYIFIVIILIFSVIIHEISHGAVAYRLGDPTAKYAGRLTLNPLKHIDPLGSVILPIILLLLSNLTGTGLVFGWAKPVPINPANFRDQKYGSLKVAAAGPASNLGVAVFFGLIIRFLPANSLASGFMLMLSYIVYINLLLAIFNLLPIPPLDGSHILFALLPSSMDRLKITLQELGFIIILFVIFFLFSWVSFIISWLFFLITGLHLF